MPRIFGVNHHPEIVNRPRQLTILRKRMERGEVTPEWYEERVAALTEDIHDHGDRALHVTSSYTLLAPLRHYLHREARRRAAAARAYARHRSRSRAGPLPRIRRSGASRRGRLAAVLPKPPFDCDLTPERELEEFRAAQAEAGLGLGHAHRQRGSAEHLGRRALADARCRGADEARRAPRTTRSGCCSC